MNLTPYNMNRKIFIPVYTLALTNQLWVRSYVSGTQLGKIKPGMRAEISTDSYPCKHYEGWVG